jgi:hypothetical protein
MKLPRILDPDGAKDLLSLFETEGYIETLEPDSLAALRQQCRLAAPLHAECDRLDLARRFTDLALKIEAMRKKEN